MHARVNTVSLSPETFEQGIKMMVTQAYPAVRLLEGYNGGLILADAQAGKALYVTFWETDEHMRRSEQEARAIRDDSAEALGLEDIPVERYEVRMLELPG